MGSEDSSNDDASLPTSVRDVADQWVFFVWMSLLLAVGLLVGPWVVEYFTAPGHSGGIRQIAFAPDDSLIFTCGEDGKLIAWTASGSLFYRYQSPQQKVAAFAIDPQGRWIAVGLEPRQTEHPPTYSVALLDLATGRELARRDEPGTALHNFRELVVNRDGTRLYVLNFESLTALSAATDPAGGWKLAQQPAWRQPLQAQAMAISLKDDLVLGLHDGSILRVDPATGDQKPAFEQLKRPIVSLAWSRDGSRLAAVGIENTVAGQIVVWTADGTRIAERKSDQLSPRAIAFATDPKQVAFGGDDYEVTWAKIERGDFERIDFWPCDKFTSIAFAHSRPLLAANNDYHTATIYDLNTKQIGFRLSGKMPGSEFDVGLALTIAMYAFPAIAILGSIFWFIGRRARQHATDLSARMREAAERMDMQYLGRTHKISPYDFEEIPLFQQGDEDREIYDLIAGKWSGGEFCIAHYHYVVVSRSKKSTTRTPWYFRIFLFPGLGPELPAFRLAPASMSEFFGELFGDRAIPLTGTATAEEFDRNFNLRSGNPFAALALFTEERMAAMLGHPGWHVQSARGHLVLWPEVGMFDTSYGGPSIPELDELERLAREAQAIAAIFAEKQPR